MINVWLLFVATVVGKSHEEYDSGNLSLFYFFYMWICIKGSLGGGDYWGGGGPSTLSSVHVHVSPERPN